MTSRLLRVPRGLAAGTEGRGALPSTGPGPHLDPASPSSLGVTLGSLSGRGPGRERPSATILGRPHWVLAAAARLGAKPISPLSAPQGPWWGLSRSQATLAVTEGGVSWWSLPGEQGQETQGQSPGVLGSRRTQPPLHIFLDTREGPSAQCSFYRRGTEARRQWARDSRRC